MEFLKFALFCFLFLPLNTHFPFLWERPSFWLEESLLSNSQCMVPEELTRRPHGWDQANEFHVPLVTVTGLGTDDDSSDIRVLYEASTEASGRQDLVSTAMKQRGYKIYSCCHHLAINGAWDWSHTPKRAEQRFKNKPWWQNLDLVSALCEANCNGLNGGHKDISTFYPLEHVNDTLHGFPGGSDGNNFCLQCRRCRFNPLVGRIPWRREWLLTPVFLLGEFSGQRSLAGYSPWGHRVRHDWATNTQQKVLPYAARYCH